MWYVSMHLSLRGAVGAKSWTPERHLEHFLRYRGICCSYSSCSNVPVLCSQTNRGLQGVMRLISVKHLKKTNTHHTRISKCCLLQVHQATKSKCCWCAENNKNDPSVFFVSLTCLLLAQFMSTTHGV